MPVLCNAVNTAVFVKLHAFALQAVAELHESTAEIVGLLRLAIHAAVDRPLWVLRHLTTHNLQNLQVPDADHPEFLVLGLARLEDLFHPVTMILDMLRREASILGEVGLWGAWESRSLRLPAPGGAGGRGVAETEQGVRAAGLAYFLPFPSGRTARGSCTPR
jgi:hypothetical protein